MRILTEVLVHEVELTLHLFMMIYLSSISVRVPNYNPPWVPIPLISFSSVSGNPLVFTLTLISRTLDSFSSGYEHLSYFGILFFFSIKLLLIKFIFINLDSVDLFKWLVLWEVPQASLVP